MPLSRPAFSRRRLVILTGAGISAESGIRTFRAADGLWEDHRIEDVATPEAFARNPALVQRFYNERRRQLQQPSIQPNAAHQALAHLEHHWDGDFLLVTQNVDDLHDRAGNQQLLHMHGELLSMFCTRTQQRYRISSDITDDMPCPCCQRTGTLRPDIVWFGERPYHMEQIYDALSHCDLFVSIGTSGNVYPAAGFVSEARSAGPQTIELNLEPSAGGTLFAEKRYGPATTLVPEFVSELLGSIRSA